ncbi:hypothetical protein [Kaistia adipata]|uniref:hypothetical protein n=1 Tax=Kaistia adipata TaxID=166954 RepID=UPI0003FFC530|nr:hypothetical protein [Kaistia adipata]
MPLTFRSGSPDARRWRDAVLASVLLVASLFGASVVARAESPTPPAAAVPSDKVPPDAGPRAGRYTMVPAEGGFVRLDTETGAVSHCRRGDAVSGGVWQCAAIPEAVIAKPQAEEKGADDNAVLRREVADLRARIKAIERRTAMAAAPPASGSGDPELDRAMNFSEELMRRFFGLVRELKQDADQGRI